MAFGVPVVSTRVFGVPELIDDGVTGYLCDTRDAGGLERTLDRALAAGPEERDRITRDAAARVAVRHEPSAYADRLWDLFEALSRDAGADARAVLFGEPAARELAP
jgi:glycosyltransferase involved in cell wall biosynthesis